MALKICDVCEGFIPPFPENEDVPGIQRCICDEERHINEQLLKSGKPSYQDLYREEEGESVVNVIP